MTKNFMDRSLNPRETLQLLHESGPSESRGIILCFFGCYPRHAAFPTERDSRLAGHFVQVIAEKPGAQDNLGMGSQVEAQTPAGTFPRSAD